MKRYELTVILDRDPSDEEADRLYGIFFDGAIGTLMSVPEVSFHREAESLAKALRSAIADLQAGGLMTMRIECDPGDLAGIA